MRNMRTILREKPATGDGQWGTGDGAAARKREPSGCIC
jgi:hypothetical protein